MFSKGHNVRINGREAAVRTWIISGREGASVNSTKPSSLCIDFLIASTPQTGTHPSSKSYLDPADEIVRMDNTKEEVAKQNQALQVSISSGEEAQKAREKKVSNETSLPSDKITKNENLGLVISSGNEAKNGRKGVKKD